MSLETLVFYKAVMVAVILLHHSNLAVPVHIERGLRRLIVPPSMHRVHHSAIRVETDPNYGTIFSFWDRLFGSLRVREDTQLIRFGIGRFAGDAWQRSGIVGEPEVFSDPVETDDRGDRSIQTVQRDRRCALVAVDREIIDYSPIAAEVLRVERAGAKPSLK